MITQEDFDRLKIGQTVYPTATVRARLRDGNVALSFDGLRSEFVFEARDIHSIEPLPEPPLGVGDWGNADGCGRAFLEVRSIDDDWLWQRDSAGTRVQVQPHTFTRTKIAGTP